jgi:hypothetical protein
MPKSQQQKLQAIIEYAVKQGYKPSFIPDWKNLEVIKLSNEWILDNDGIIRASINGILFSHKFSKAMFPDCDCEKEHPQQDIYHPPLSKWKMHLSNAVLSKDPIQYYYDYIKGIE